jgi:hypothetical protein
MMLIQLILVAIILIGLWQVLTATRHYRSLLVLVGMAGIVLILAPNFSTDLAKRLGIGRGADLVIYLSIALLGMLWVRMFLRGRTDQRQVTILARNFAIIQARFPGVSVVNADKKANDDNLPANPTP